MKELMFVKFYIYNIPSWISNKNDLFDHLLRK